MDLADVELFKRDTFTCKMATLAAGLVADDSRDISDRVVTGSLRRQRFFRDLANPLEDHRTEPQIKLRFRFYRETIYDILALIFADLVHATRRSRALPPLIQLLIALRFYACGAFYHVVGDHVHVDKSTACRALTRVSLALRALTKKVIVFPNRKKQAENKMKFGSFANFPGVIGLVDGCLFEVKKNMCNRNNADFVCRKQFPAINTQVSYQCIT
jgi:hypothetical protein